MTVTIHSPKNNALTAADTTMFDTCIVIRNPASTRAKRTDWRIDELRTLFPSSSLIIAETSAAGRASNQTLLRRYTAKLGPHCLVVILAGDGTASIIIDSLIRDVHLTPAMRQTIILPLWGGNANDLATMLNGSGHHRPIQRLLQAGRPVAIHPLLVTITDQTGQANTYSAVCYASFGASAYATHFLETVDRPKRTGRNLTGARFIRELALVAWAMTKAPKFSIQDGSTNKTIYEHIFINGSRFAKVVGLPLELTDKEFYRAMVEQKGISSITHHILKLRRKYRNSTVGKNTISFQVNEPVWAQVDGEAMAVTAGSKVQLSISPQAFRTISRTSHRQKTASFDNPNA